MTKRKVPIPLPYDKARLTTLRKMSRSIKKSGMTAENLVELAKLELIVKKHEASLKAASAGGGDAVAGTLTRSRRGYSHFSCHPWVSNWCLTLSITLCFRIQLVPRVGALRKKPRRAIVLHQRQCLLVKPILGSSRTVMMTSTTTQR
jgi:hypothetical protein